MEHTHKKMTKRRGDPPENLIRETHLVSSNSSVVTLYENVLSQEESLRFLQLLKKELPWKVYQDDFGPQSRPTCYFGDPDCIFTYVGLRLEPLDWNASIAVLKERVCAACGIDNSLLSACLVNLYEDGTGYIPWHYDEVRAHGDSKIVASLSLGGPRRFSLRKRNSEKQIAADAWLPSGSIVLMKGAVQEKYEHCLPLEDGGNNPLRISLTFRSIVPGFERDKETAIDACIT